MRLSSKSIMILLLIIVISTVTVGGITFWNQNYLVDREGFTRTVTFEVDECTYGSVYLASDSRTSSVVEWAGIVEADRDGLKMVSADSNNPVTVDVSIEVPSNEPHGVKYFKVVFEDHDNKKTYEKVVSFNV